MRVLVVDDDADTREAIVDLLKDEGFDVRDATDGREALAVLAASVPDVILADAVMPGMDGWRLMEELRRLPHLAEVPVVLMTGISRSRLDARGAVSVLQKPFSGSELVKAVSSACRGSLQGSSGAAHR